MTASSERSARGPFPGPLAGVKVVEMAGLGPAPFAAMLLADMGADVLVIERAHHTPALSGERRRIIQRSRRIVGLDAKSPEGLEALLAVIDRADVLVEGFRPGVMERLGAGPDVCLARNPRLVFGRMTGWGQTGPLAHQPGHDVNYLSIGGSLGLLGHPELPPPTPLNFIGDDGIGASLFAFGMVAALFEAARSGIGQVVDAATADCAALSIASIWEIRSKHEWVPRRGGNALDGAAPFYNVYECADGRYLSVGPAEPQFFAEFVKRLGLDVPSWLDMQFDESKWPQMKAQVAAIVSTKTQEEWSEVFSGSDACAFPVLDLEEVLVHPHHRARGTFVTVDGIEQPAPAPRLSRTPGGIRPRQAEDLGVHEILSCWGMPADDLDGVLGPFVAAE